jgi:hypothetical protein
MEAISRAMAQEEAGLEVEPELLDAIAELRVGALPFLTGGRK